MQRTSSNVLRLGTLGLGTCLLVSTLVLAPACSIGADPAPVADGGAAIPPGCDAGPDDAGTGAGGGDGAPPPDAAPNLPHDRPPIDEATHQNLELATFALG